MSNNPLQDPILRLECLKLANRAGVGPEEIILTAKLFLTWVAGATDNAKAPDGRQHGNRPR